MDLCLAFIDLTMSFDSVNRETLWACLARLGCPPKFVNITRKLHEGKKGCVLLRRHWCKAGLCDCSYTGLYISGGFYITSSSRPSQGCRNHLSHRELFNMRHLKAKTKVKAISIVDLQYADDCAIAAHTEAELQNTLDAFSEAYKLLGLTVNVTKTKVIFLPAQPLRATAPNMDIEGTTLENVDHFACLGLPLEVGKHRCRNST